MIKQNTSTIAAKIFLLGISFFLRTQFYPSISTNADNKVLPFLEFVKASLKDDFRDDCTMIFMSFEGTQHSKLININNSRHSDASNMKSTLASSPVDGQEPNMWEDTLRMLSLDVDLSWTQNLFYSINNETLFHLKENDLNIICRCPVYVSYSPDIFQLYKLFHCGNLDWDKYIYSRKHIVYTESDLDDVRLFFKDKIINEFMNLLFFWSDLQNQQIKILSNKPFDSSKADPISFIGAWNENKRGKNMNYFNDKLKDFNKYKMRVISFDFPPRVFMRNESGKLEVGGIDGQVVMTITEALNIVAEFTNPSDGEMWGWELPNGTWTGLMGDLQFGRAHLAVADLYIMEPYFKVCDMSIQYDIDYLTCVNPVPGPLPQWVALTLPFTPVTWGVIIASIFLGQIVIVVLTKLSHKSRVAESEWFRSASNNLMLILSCVVNISSIRTPRSTPLRIFFILWSLAFLIIGIVYKSSLYALLTIPINQPPIDTYRELFSKGSPVGSMGLTFQKVMDSNADPWVRKLAPKYVMVKTPDEGFRETVSGKLSFMESKGFLDYEIAEKYTDQYDQTYLHVMKEYVAPFGVGIAFPKYASYIAAFNGVIRQITEAGLAGKWQNDILLRAKRTKKYDTNGSVESSPEGNPLTVNNLQGGFILLIIGNITTIMVLIAEITITKLGFNRKKNKNNN